MIINLPTQILIDAIITRCMSTLQSDCAFGGAQMKFVANANSAMSLRLSIVGVLLP
jgi:hypothetical protein